MASVEVSGTPVEIAAPEKSEAPASIDQSAEDATESSPPTVTEVNPKVDESVDLSGDSIPTDIKPPPSTDDQENSTPAAAPDQDQTPKGLAVDEIPSKGTDDPAANEEITGDAEVAVTEVKDESPDIKSLVAESESESSTIEEITTGTAIDHVAPTAKAEIPEPNDKQSEVVDNEFSVKIPEEKPSAVVVAATDAASEQILSAEDTSTPVVEETPAAEANTVST